MQTMEDVVLCRICLKTKNCVRNISNDSVNALHDIFLIKIEPNDQKFSFHMCFSCEQKLIQFYKFYQQVKRNQVFYETSTQQGTWDQIGSPEKELPLFVKLETDLDYLSDDPITNPLSAAVDDCDDDEDEMEENKDFLSKDEEEDEGEILEESKTSIIEENGTAPTKKKRGRKKGTTPKNNIPEGVDLKGKKYPRGARVCPICGKVRGVKNFKQHMRFHEKRRIREEQSQSMSPYICDICQFQTQHKPALKQHMDVRHLLVRKHMCEICGKGFFKPRDMKIHYRRHHQERKREKCSDCGKYYLDVRSHKARNHIVQGIFVCGICSREFENKRKLVGHIARSHKKVECFVCGSKFRNKTVLKEHMHQKHINGDPLYCCKWCDFRGNYRKNMNAHCKKYHPEEYRTVRLQYEMKHDQPELPEPHALEITK